MVKMLRKVSLSITVILFLIMQKPVASFFDQRTHIIPWTSLPGSSVPYSIWSSIQRFSVDDNVVFVFPPGLHTVAEVTKNGYDKCTPEIISLVASSPATFTLDSVGRHYYICTVRDHCHMGQKLAINVPDSPSTILATSAPLLSSSGRNVSDKAITTHIVGDEFGWAPSSGGASDYKAWSSNRTFHVGDTLVFKFVNKLQDVALVTKSAYEKCDTRKSAIAVYKNSPATVLLKSTGYHYFTTTNPQMCDFGQQLAINVRAR